MFRNRVRPPTPPLDEVIAERLLGGAPIDDLPEAYRPLASLLADASGPATDGELEGSAVAAAEFVAVHDASTTPRRRTRSMASSVLLALTVAASSGTAVAATQGVLPEPIQQVAHEALGVVGISVPGITKQGDDPGGTDGNEPGVGAAGTTTPSTTTPRPAALAPAAAVDGPTTAVEGGDQPVADDPPPSDGKVDNPNSGPGKKSPQGNQNPGGGNQGNTGGDDPSPNLPPQSNGRGNGPPQTPPGQAKKLG